MPEVSVEQIRCRLAMYRKRREYFEWKSNNTSGRLRRHEVWRHHYLCDPYLTGSTDERLADRFKHIFINQTELGPNGKIGVLPVTDSADGFIQKFTHILEEYGGRGGEPPNHVIEAARAPILKYFERGDPIAVKMFDGYCIPKSPIFVKYGNKQFLNDMFERGVIRISPASFYNNQGFLDAVKDDEVSRYFFIPTYRDRLKGEFDMEFQGHRIEYGNDDIALPVVVPDYYLTSLCDHIYYRMPTDFAADAAIIIRDPMRFTQLVISHFLARWPEWEPMQGPVSYYDPYRDYEKVRVPEMCKHFGYSYQREVRIAFRPKRPIISTLEPVFISIGSMAEYADFVCA